MRTLVALGDSQTDFGAGFGVRPSETHTSKTAQLLGPDWLGRGFGVSGNKTPDLLARLDVALMYGVPDIAIAAIGVNDNGTYTQAQTQANIQAIIMALKHGAMGPGAGLGGPVTVADVASLPATGGAGQCYVVLSDTDATGGATAWHSSHKANVSGSVAADGNGQKQSVWEFRYPLAGARGWGRVAVTGSAPTVVKKIMVTAPPYRNFTTGGDTPSTALAINVAIRAAQAAAVAAENITVGGQPTAIYCDLHAFLKARIVAGTDPDFSAVAWDQTRAWHYTSNDQHYNTYGHLLQAQKQAADIQTAWPSLF